MDIEFLKDRAMLDLMPKVELHRHIEGAFCLDTLFKLSLKNKVSNAPKNLDDFLKITQFPKDHGPDFELFLSLFRNDWYASLEDVEEIIYNSVKKFQEENLFFIELRFSPEHFALVNNFDRIETSKVIIHAANKAAKEIGLTIRYLITFNRNKQNEQEMLNLYNLIKKAKLPDIVGVDLAGNEVINPPEEFKNFFSVAHSDGMGITIHAGEVTDAKQIRVAIDDLHAKRIGHGTQAIRDKKMIEDLIKREIVLEQAPISNYLTGSWKDVESHPFKDLYGQGVLVTLNSDDPTIQHTTLTDDFLAAQNYYGITYDKLVGLNIRAIDSSFEPNKQEIVKQYILAVQNFERKHLKKH